MMHLLLLGLVLVVGILVYYIMTTGGSPQDKKKGEPQRKVSENLRKEDNVIFLPTADSKQDDKGDTKDAE